MKKKICALLTAALLVLTLFSPKTLACTPGQGYNPAAFRAAEVLVEDCNAAIRLMVRVAQLTWVDDAAAMKSATDALAAATSLAVKCLGFTTECTYTEYLVDGHRVMIDPLRVINPLEDTSDEGGRE